MSRFAILGAAGRAALMLVVTAKKGYRRTERRIKRDSEWQQFAMQSALGSDFEINVAVIMGTIGPSTISILISIELPNCWHSSFSLNSFTATFPTVTGYP